MSRQDKSVTERHARALRELVKRPDNKVCADCKRNDPRWASWNLGVFLCIRCSGIHRSMGTHISRVKSIDLDVWTPEQMESITKWGNARANLYWEAHLKTGHVPPDHKVESFIRSKYESRRWALDIPVPHDPSSLEMEGKPKSQGHEIGLPSEVTPPKMSGAVDATIAASKSSTSGISFPPRQLISSSHIGLTESGSKEDNLHRTSDSIPTSDDLFSLDFNKPQEVSGGVSTLLETDVKGEILSLYSPSSANKGISSQFSGSYSSAANQAQHMTFSDRDHSRQLDSSTRNANELWGWSSSSNNVWGSLSASQPALQDAFSGAKSSTVTGSGFLGNLRSGSAKETDDTFADIWSEFR